MAGFSDKLRLFNLLMDDIRQTADLPVKSCRECRFAHGGQYFAVPGWDGTIGATPWAAP